MRSWCRQNPTRDISSVLAAHPSPRPLRKDKGEGAISSEPGEGKTTREDGFMIRTNGNTRRSSVGLGLALMDGFLIVISVWAADILRFWGEDNYILRPGSTWKLLVLLPAVQIVFYYFGLYELRNLRGRIKMSLLLLGSLGISFLTLAILYYLVPSLILGRGILSLIFFFILVSAFLGRLVYAALCRKISKERILIVGTGELAKRITREIYENGQDIFEIIGFVGK